MSVPKSKIPKIKNTRVCIPLFLHACLYSTLSPPCRSKQTMTRWMDDRTDGRMDDETDGWNDASWRPVLYNITRKTKKQNAFATPTFVKEKLYLHNDLSCEPFVCEFGGHLKKWNALCTVTCPLLKLPPFWKFPQPCSLRWEIPSGGGRPFMPWTLSSALGSRTADFWRMLYDDVNLPNLLIGFLHSENFV